MLKLARILIVFSFLLTLPHSGIYAVVSDGGSNGGTSGIDGSSINQLGTIIQRIIYFLFGIIGGIAIIMLVVGGIRYILAGGDPKATGSAKQTIQFAILGLIIVLLAVVIVNIVGGVFGVSGLTTIRIGVN